MLNCNHISNFQSPSIVIKNTGSNTERRVHTVSNPSSFSYLDKLDPLNYHIVIYDIFLEKSYVATS